MTKKFGGALCAFIFVLGALSVRSFGQTSVLNDLVTDESYYEK